ncbi:MAG: class I SAM-dependent methyltransferase [Alphaproteobacteria bacterium]|nr:class I SAM-dependent methyltransferase [Alphaproteobacteria bacterium]MBL7098737.1 class I SAM-dependent methyltransferase [Alphaproteobacteria bacterium]
MTYTVWKTRLTQGNAFDNADVARCYAHRPPYAPALLGRLLELAPGRNQLVDLGCGPGKVAVGLAPHFAHTLALDPAAAMIDEARHAHSAPNITWLHASAEDAPLPDRIDLVTAGTSVHWMKHAVVFPKLAERTDLFATLWVEAPPDPRWDTAYRALMTDWLGRIGQIYDPMNFPKRILDYEAWLDKQGHETFRVPFRQSIDGYIAQMHSTATFSRARMGADLAEEFGSDLRDVLAPYASDGLLIFDTVSTLVWGTPRRYAHGTES